MATLFSQACVHDENELISVASPGASLTYAGGLHLWQMLLQTSPFMIFHLLWISASIMLKTTGSLP